MQDIKMIMQNSYCLTVIISTQLHISNISVHDFFIMTVLLSLCFYTRNESK